MSRPADDVGLDQGGDRGHGGAPARAPLALLDVVSAALGGVAATPGRRLLQLALLGLSARPPNHGAANRKAVGKAALGAGRASTLAQLRLFDSPDSGGDPLADHTADAAEAVRLADHQVAADGGAQPLA